MQDLSYDEQLARKTEQIRTLFPDVDVAPCVPSPRDYGYRSKLTPHFPRPRPGQPLRIGFLEVGLPRRTIDVPTCPIATPAVNARLAELRAEVEARRETYKRGATLLVREAASGVTVDPRAIITEQVGDLALQFLAGDFFQNNPFLLPRLAGYVADEAKAGGARFLVDAYCGSGLLALAAFARLRAGAGRRGEPQRGSLGGRQRHPQRAHQL
jgi:23S rRNA (uracil1939-C5)-methyltransferase/tRNA (uracil-5-)-methyltransferase